MGSVVRGSNNSEQHCNMDSVDQYVSDESRLDFKENNGRAQPSDSSHRQMRISFREVDGHTPQRDKTGDKILMIRVIYTQLSMTSIELGDVLSTFYLASPGRYVWFRDV